MVIVCEVLFAMPFMVGTSVRQNSVTVLRAPFFLHLSDPFLVPFEVGTSRRFSTL
jgi:hypothetical protein